MVPGRPSFVDAADWRVRCRRHGVDAEQTSNSYANRRTAYERVLTACPDATPVFTEFTTLLLKQRDFQTALIWSQKGLAKSSNDPHLSLNLAIALLGLGKAHEAVEVLQKIPANGKTRFNLGMAYRALNNHKAARDALASAIAHGYDDPYVFYERINQDRLMGDKATGLEDYKAFVAKFPESPWLHVLYGDAYLAKSQDLQAEQEYREAVNLAPNLPVVHFELGVLAFRRSDYTAGTTQGAIGRSGFRRGIPLLRRRYSPVGRRSIGNTAFGGSSRAPARFAACL